MNQGRLIVLEGGEEAGKTTQARLLAGRLDAMLTREPGGTSVGEGIRSILLNRATTELDARAELLLMVAARAQHVVERIRPAIALGRDVVCDRYSGSTLAYQGYGRGLALEVVQSACDIAEDGVAADLSVLLDVPIEIGLERLSSGLDRIESEDRAFHARVFNGFRALATANPNSWVIVDGVGDPLEVAERIGTVVVQRLAGVGVRVQR